MPIKNINGEIFDENGNYIYQNVELTPKVLADLLVYLFNSKQFKRQEAIEASLNFHLSKGGISHKNNYIGAYKKAVNSPGLKEFIKNVHYGTWLLSTDDKDLNQIEMFSSNKSEKKPEFIIDTTLGEGDSSVYVYYYDIYKKMAKLENRNFWECKVGMTDRGVLERIFSQSGTAYPEYPHIALQIKCKDSFTMEAALHSALKLRGKWISNSPGTEWFLTSPEEIQELYYALIGLPALDESKSSKINR